MQRKLKGENLEFPAVQTSSLDQWWCQQLSRDQFLNKKRRCMQRNAMVVSATVAHRGVGGSDGTRRGQCYSTLRIVGYCHCQVWLLAAAAYF